RANRAGRAGSRCSPTPLALVVTPSVSPRFAAGAPGLSPSPEHAGPLLLERPPAFLRVLGVESERLQIALVPYGIVHCQVVGGAQVELRYLGRDRRARGDGTCYVQCPPDQVTCRQHLRDQPPPQSPVGVDWVAGAKHERGVAGA